MNFFVIGSIFVELILTKLVQIELMLEELRITSVIKLNTSLITSLDKWHFEPYFKIFKQDKNMKLILTQS